MSDVGSNSYGKSSSSHGAPAASAEPQWHIHIPPDTYGPCPLPRLREFAQDGRLTADTLVWAEGDEGWAAAGDHPVLKALFAAAQRASAPPAPPARAPSPTAAASVADADDSAPEGPHRGGVNVAALRTMIAQRQGRASGAASADRTAPTGGGALTFAESLQSCLQRQYAGFHGRARRSEYWWFALFISLVGGVVETIAVSVSLATSTGGSMSILGILALALAGLVMLGLALPAIAVAVRRLHDLGWSGWWHLTLLIPIVNGFAALAMLIAFMMPGNEGPNKYGPDPVAPRKV